MFDLLRPLFKWALIIAVVLVVMSYIFGPNVVFGALGHLWYMVGHGLHHARIKAHHG